MLERDLDNDPEFLRWHADLCREDARLFYRDHRRYEYLRRLSVPQFRFIYLRALNGEKFDDVIDACLAGCKPECRNDNHPGCAICIPVSEPGDEDGRYERGCN